jgi:hypothetical protein
VRLAAPNPFLRSDLASEVRLPSAPGNLSCSKRGTLFQNCNIRRKSSLTHAQRSLLGRLLHIDPNYAAAQRRPQLASAMLGLGSSVDISNHAGSVKLFWSTPGHALQRGVFLVVLTLRIDDHGSFAIYRADSVRPFDPYFDHNYYFWLPFSRSVYRAPALDRGYSISWLAKINGVNVGAKTVAAKRHPFNWIVPQLTDREF